MRTIEIKVKGVEELNNDIAKAKMLIAELKEVLGKIKRPTFTIKHD